MSRMTKTTGCPFARQNVEPSRRIGTRTFPTRSDYEKYLISHSEATRPHQVWNTEELVITAQRHWHSSGQNGCVFAQWIAKQASARQWASWVTTGEAENMCSGAVDLIEEQIQGALQDPECEILSLLFPGVIADRQLARFLHRLLDLPSINLVDETVYGPYTTLAMRVEIPSTGSQSWLMGFGPFWFLPCTRQAPSAEIAIRVKPKPAVQFYRLNQDPAAAHLADYPTSMSDASWEAVWRATLKNTRDVLGGEPDEISAAKVSFPIPSLLWEEICS